MIIDGLDTQTIDLWFTDAATGWHIAFRQSRRNIPYQWRARKQTYSPKDLVLLHVPWGKPASAHDAPPPYAPRCIWEEWLKLTTSDPPKNYVPKASQASLFDSGIQQPLFT